MHFTHDIGGGGVVRDKRAMGGVGRRDERVALGAVNKKKMLDSIKRENQNICHTHQGNGTHTQEKYEH